MIQTLPTPPGDQSTVRCVCYSFALFGVLLVGCQPRQPAAPPKDQVSLTTSAEPVVPATQPVAADDQPPPGITEEDLDRIETELKIKLPAEYRQFMPPRREKILSYTYPLRGETRFWLDSDFFLDADRLISENLGQREADGAAADSFPKWWEKNVLFGTNGGGDYYVLRLDGQPGVWFLDCDAAEISKYADSLEDYMAKRLEDFPQELAKYKRLEVLWQQKEKGELGEEEFNKKWQAILEEP